MIEARSSRMRRWSRREYEQLVERSFFRPDERLELLDGLLLVKEPQSSAHMTAIRLVQEALRAAFGAGWDVRRAFARAGVPEYWIVNLVDRVLEVHREPGRLDDARRRWGYRSVQTLGSDAAVGPPAAPGARIPVADVLP
jgi:Uma2 family endonuclease